MAYPGGKSGAGVYQKLINLMPPHDVYIEPFLGGGAVMRLKRPAALNIGIDLDPAPLEMAGSVAMQPEGERLRHHRSSKLAMLAAEPDPIVKSSVEYRIAKSSVEVLPVATIGKSGVVRSRNRSGIAASTDCGSAFEFRFLQADGIEFLRSYRFTGSELVYCDPPYLMSTRSGRRMYKFEMNEISHRRLLRVIREIPARVMISGYWSSLYAASLQAWNSINFQSMTRGGKPATEYVWFNFPAPVELHDYAFLGSNFRERERIMRKKRRWVKRLERMPVLERQALLSAIADSDISGDASSF